MLFDYFLETNKDHEIIGAHRIRNEDESTDEFIKVALASLVEQDSIVVHVDAVEYYRFVESPEYLPDDVLTAIRLRSRPYATWNHNEKKVEFYPLLKLNTVDSCEFIEEGANVSAIIGDVPGLYRVTGAYPVIRFNIECVCHDGDKKEAEKDIHTLDLDEFDVLISTGNNILLPNKDIRVHMAQRNGSGQISITVPNPKTNLMMVSLKHKRALMSTYAFYFVWNEGQNG